MKDDLIILGEDFENLDAFLMKGIVEKKKKKQDLREKMKRLKKKKDDVCRDI